MNACPLIVAFALTSLMASIALTARAQTVPGNEAVTTGPDGRRQVETPPLPATTLRPPCLADRPGCGTGGWLMLETTEGLRECTEFYARDGTCRASTYGVEKRPRLWIVKTKGQWMQCDRPTLTSRCVSLKALPTSIVQ